MKTARPSWKHDCKLVRLHTKRFAPGKTLIPGRFTLPEQMTSSGPPRDGISRGEAYKKNMFALLGKPSYEEQKAELEARL